MNISDKYQLIFFHLPKCAGKSVVSSSEIKILDKTNIESKIRQTVALGFDYWYWNQKIYPKKWNEYTKFTIVINPWDRIVSWWKWSGSGNFEDFWLFKNEKNHLQMRTLNSLFEELLEYAK